ncbi:hypothetical protein PCANC_06877 [Puccinia coronata f. sp. avenae]|uniref:Uncharacterized protein n=1 Tax=Puccinia coronata f. sp. avenae TaxID=200324 RepID=A0A2N5VGV7_9BASI|nr:hypothetical protein PCANC_06877 [Puccinia coronata f. sp. avenae]
MRVGSLDSSQSCGSIDVLTSQKYCITIIIGLFENLVFNTRYFYSSVMPKKQS